MRRPRNINIMRSMVRFVGLICASLAFVYCGIIGNAEAVQIKKVYRGTVNFDTTDIVQSVDLGAAVDTTKSLILITNTAATNTADQNDFYTTQFEDPSTITINRNGTVYGGVSWEVIEFNDGVNVQRGISSMQAGVLTKTIDLPTSITSSKAIPIVYTQNTETGKTITHLYPALPYRLYLATPKLYATFKAFDDSIIPVSLMV